MRRMALSVAALVTLAACDSGTEQRSDVTAGRAVMQSPAPLPPGAVPRGAAAEAAALAPPGPEPTPELLRRGQERFAIFCTPCHGTSGAGDGTVVSRGFPPPPRFRDERLREVSREHIVGVITLGKGNMLSYAERVPSADRWAIASYVKALQQEGGADPGRPPAAPEAKP